MAVEKKLAARRAKVLVFAKAPIPGYCKTRLAQSLGAIGAARVQTQLTHHILDVATASGFDTELWCAPSSAHPSVRRLRVRYGVRLHRQPCGDLGQRMSIAISYGLKATPVVLVLGTDCPTLTPKILHQAVEVLQRGVDAVFVPAEDGGYVLVGLNKPRPRLFRGVQWGGAYVMAQTRRRARRLGLCYHELPPLWDVDDRRDWVRARRGGWL